ncbi:hypothetical protein K502DRAFT_292604 [Neoconidiobolus thromboides FSU 785]|nr:hypothetical protein K502DRAFT_292604 [Neoconidiobolus thromboides FSU 785]
MKEELKNKLVSQKKYIPVFFSEEEASNHYEGYCKSELWPMFHYLLEDMRVDMKIQKEHWEGYVNVNQHFADSIIQFYQPGDFIWIHDYHLMLVPEMIRKAIPDANIGFFLHAPFPSSEIFRCLPRRKEILKGILSSNLVGLQTYSYARHFISTCTRVLGLEPAPEGIDYKGSIITVDVFPIGVDAKVSELHRASFGVQHKINSLKELYSGKKVIFGRDKLDQATGVLQKFKTYELFLQKYPEWQGKVVLVQVSSTLHSLPNLEKKISEIVTRINSRFGSLEYSPVHHFQHSIEREEYYGLLSMADVALITSVRDGMNTTSHEFILCQKGNYSPLILSEFTGTAGSLEEAILVNPFDYSGVADALNDALTLSHEKKVEVHNALYKRVTTQDATFWAQSFVTAMKKCCSSFNNSNPTPFLEFDLIKKVYSNSKKRLILFDYDGTLTEIRSVPSAAIPSEKMLNALKTLTKDPKNVVWIISGRDQKALIEWMGDVPNLGLSAEHGCFMKYPESNLSEWINLAEDIDLSWRDDVTEIFTYYTERTQGSFIEHKRASLTWHYRMADPSFGSFQAKECQNHLENAVVSKLPVEILIGKKNIEVRPVAINKGEIVKRIISANPDCDFIFCAGDDKTDEDMFRVLNNCDIEEDKVFGTTIGTSSKKTLANWHVNDPQQIIEIMQKLPENN